MDDNNAFRKILLSRKVAEMARRRYQKGSLTDDKDRWKVRWREDVIDAATGDIKRVYRQDYISKKAFPTRRLAQRELDRRLEEINREGYKPVLDETFGKFAARWKKTVLIHDKPSTQSSDESVIDVHLIPSFGDFAFREITGETLQAWVSSHKLAPKTIRNHIRLMSRMWKTAKNWGYTQADPFPGLKLPTVVKGHVYFFSPEEALAIISAAKGWKQIFFRIMAETGIRPGELAGLRVEDVQGRILLVKQSVWQREVQTPKTDNAVRKFSISEGLAADMKAHIDAMKENTYGIVFAAESGRPLSMDNFRHRTLKPILVKLKIWEKVKAAGVRCGNYAFRHMNATLMDGLNTPLKTRTARLGHADASTTIENYTHAVDAADLAVSDAVGPLFTPKKTGEAIQ